MEVRVISKAGEVRIGRASFSPDRRKPSVYVAFDRPIKVPYPEPGLSYDSRGEEFYLQGHGLSILVWGQGTEFPNDAWSLHPDDATAILAGGGG